MSKPSDTPTQGVPTSAQKHAGHHTPESGLGSRDEPSAGELGRVREAVRGRMFPEMQAELDGRYRIQELVGRGGLGQVYKAYDTKLQRNVAIKFLRSTSSDHESARALEREAQVLAQLQHPNIVAVHDVGRSQDELYLTMELIDGMSLAAWLTEDERPWRSALPLMMQAAKGLAAAHDADVVHRDFKPANVMVDRTGRVRVVDFGLAREVVWTADDAVSSVAAAVVHTKAAGTPPYMAPEQFDGQVSAASDQFAFCTSLYEALCGERPWRGMERGIGDREDALRIDQGLRKRGVDGFIRRAVLQGLQLRPSDRFAEMHALLRALERPRARWPWMVGGVAVSLGATLGVFAMQRPEPCVGRGVAGASLWSAHDADAVLGGLDDIEVARDVSDRLDAFAERWNAADHQTCEAAAGGELSPGLAVLRTRCLERVAAHVRTTLETVSAGEYSDARVQRAVVSATSLRACLDDDGLVGAVPEKGYDREEGERIQRAIDTAFVYASLGDDARWLSSLESLHDSISSPGTALPDEVWLAHHLGGALLRRGRLGQARDVLMPALLEAKRHPGWVLQTSMLQVQLARLASLEGRHDEAELLISVAEPALSTLSEQQHACVAATTHAQISNGADRPLAALQHLDRADGIEAAAGAEADTWAGLDAIRIDRAITRCTAAISLNRLKEGERLCREVLRLQDDAGTLNTGIRAAALNNIALALREQGRLAKALPLLREAALLKERGGDARGAAESWINLGNALEANGDHHGGLAAYADAQRLLGTSRGPGAVSFRFNRAVSYASAGAWAQAVLDYEEALDIAGELGDRVEVNVTRYDIEVGFGVALAAAGEATRAARVLERALRRETAQSDSYSKAELRIALAALVQPGARRAQMIADARKAAADSGDPELMAAATAVR